MLSVCRFRRGNLIALRLGLDCATLPIKPKRLLRCVAYYGLAGMYAEERRLPEARAAIAKALALQPENVEFQRLSAKLGTGS